jgi:uncharacterized protein (DUF952 family)
MTTHAAGPWLHLVPEATWRERGGAETYLPDAYEADGFIHCTIGDTRMLEVANLFYQADPRPMIALTLDPAAIGSEVRFEDPESVFPHIYGPLHTAAVTSWRPVERDADGRFTGYGAPVSR